MRIIERPACAHSMPAPRQSSSFRSGAGRSLQALRSRWVSIPVVMGRTADGQLKDAALKFAVACLRPFKPNADGADFMQVTNVATIPAGYAATDLVLQPLVNKTRR